MVQIIALKETVNIYMGIQTLALIKILPILCVWKNVEGLRVFVVVVQIQVQRPALATIFQ